MRVFGWLRGRGAPRLDPRIAGWRRDWAAAGAGANSDAVEALRARLDALGLPEDEIEIEREMLDALRALGQLRELTRAGGLPMVETGHRAIGADRCHFSAPASMPDADGQPSGRLLLTATRAIFLGGPGATSVPWHAVGQALHHERDLVLVRKDRDHLYRFRCNSFADALCGAFLAQQLTAARPSDRSARASRT
jgi:hypothetical protein